MYFLGGSIASRFLPFRLEFAGAIYHLTGRGNARQKVFFTDADRELFLSTLAGVVSRTGSLSDQRKILIRQCMRTIRHNNHYNLIAMNLQTLTQFDGRLLTSWVQAQESEPHATFTRRLASERSSIGLAAAPGRRKF